MGGTVGNRNAAGNTNALGTNQTAPKPFIDAVNRACKQEDGKRLRKAAEELLNLAAAGEAWAIKELADRLDGKSKQQTELTGPNDGPIVVSNVGDALALLLKIKGVE